MWVGIFSGVTSAGIVISSARHGTWKMNFNTSEYIIKDHVKSVLHISSAHNKGGPAGINIAQIFHLSNFVELKRTLVYIHLQ